MFLTLQMKRVFKTRPTKEKFIHQSLLLTIISLISLFMLFSCHKTKFQWEPGISAPKYYPVAGNVNFGNAGHGSNTAFDNGWEDTYGAVSSGDRYKEAPKEVYINYYSVVDSKNFEGIVKLPQEKIRYLFEKYNLDRKYNLGHLVVGMAPGGWIKVWFQTLDEKANDLVSVEVVKAQLKGFKNDSVGIGLKTKNFKTWGNTYTYWQLHGIPYEAWAENEKEYDIYFDFYTSNHEEVGYGYVSKDGTYYQGIGIEKKFHQKLPVEIEFGWIGKMNKSYCCKVTMPKNFQKYLEQKKMKEVSLHLEIEKDDEHAILCLIRNNEKEKIVRFRNKIPTAEEKKNKDYSYATEIEYFIP